MMWIMYTLSVILKAVHSVSQKSLSVFIGSLINTILTHRPPNLLVFGQHYKQVSMGFHLSSAVSAWQTQALSSSLGTKKCDTCFMLPLYVVISLRLFCYLEKLNLVPCIYSCYILSCLLSNATLQQTLAVI